MSRSHPSHTLTWFTVDIPYVRKGSRKQKPQSRLNTTTLETKQSSENQSCTIFFPFVVLFSFSSYLSSHRLLILFKYVPLLVSSSGPVPIRLNTVASNWPFHDRPCALKSTFHTWTAPTFLLSSSRPGYCTVGIPIFFTLHHILCIRSFCSVPLFSDKLLLFYHPYILNKNYFWTYMIEMIFSLRVWFLFVNMLMEFINVMCDHRHTMILSWYAIFCCQECATTYLVHCSWILISSLFMAISNNASLNMVCIFLILQQYKYHVKAHHFDLPGNTKCSPKYYAELLLTNTSGSGRLLNYL